MSLEGVAFKPYQEALIENGAQASNRHQGLCKGSGRQHLDQLLWPPLSPLLGPQPFSSL